MLLQLFFQLELGEICILKTWGTIHQICKKKKKKKQWDRLKCILWNDVVYHIGCNKSLLDYHLESDWVDFHGNVSYLRWTLIDPRIHSVLLYFCIFGIFHPNDQLMYGHNQATWVCTMWNQLRITYHWSGYHLQKYSWFQFSLGGQNERILRWILCEIDDRFRLKKIIFHLYGMCYSKWLVQCFWPINSILMGVSRWLLAGCIPIYKWTEINNCVLMSEPYWRYNDKTFY